MSQTPHNTPLFGDTQEQLEILIEGVAYQVPADLELLRCFQYLGFDIAFERFCWNASCENCEARVAPPNGPPDRTLCCQRICEPGLQVLSLPEGVKVKAVP